MPRTRSPNEGTIYRDRRTGRYVARLPARYGRQSRAGFRTRSEALAWLRQEVARRERDPVPLAADRTTLADYLAYWLQQVTPTLRPATARGYAWVCRRYLVPALGTVPLGRLRPTQIQAFYTALQQGGRLGPATVRAVHAALRRALRCAVQWGLLERSPLERVVAPPPPRPRVAYGTPDEGRPFLEAVRDHPWESLSWWPPIRGCGRGSFWACAGKTWISTAGWWWSGRRRSGCRGGAGSSGRPRRSGSGRGPWPRGRRRWRPGGRLWGWSGGAGRGTARAADGARPFCGRGAGGGPAAAAVL